MKRLAFLLLLTQIPYELQAQQITGKLRPHSSWNNRLYLSEVKSFFHFFSGLNKLIIDSCTIKEDGTFFFERLKPNTIYRLTSEKLVEPAFILNDGTQDNYCFFSFTKKEEQIYLEGDISQLFVSANFTGHSERMKQFDSIVKLKRPAYAMLASFQKERRDDSAYMQQYMRTLISSAEATNLDLNRYLNTLSDPVSITFGAAFLAYDGLLQNHMNLLRIHISKLKAAKAPVVQSLYKELAKSTDSTSEFFALINAPLRCLDGSTIQLDTVTSRFVLFDFWASWCTPCRRAIRKELPALQSYYSKEVLTIIGINEDHHENSAREAMTADHNVTIQIHRLHPRNKQYLQGIRTTLLPLYVLYDRQKQQFLSAGNLSVIQEALSKN